MKRFHFIEIEDQTWCPKKIRDGVTDFLQYIVRAFHLYKAIAPRLRAAINDAGQGRVVDLCSGGAGPWLSLLSDLKTQNSDFSDLKVTLSDLYPNNAAFNAAYCQYPQQLGFSELPVDATKVVAELSGFRTLFSSFHHFKPDSALAVLQSAVDAKTGIAIFESTQRHPLMLLYMLITPLLVWINTPFIRPFRWDRLFWTYLIPIIPLIVMFDGVVSCLRTYTVEELEEMVSRLDAPDYCWDIGLEPIGRMPVGVTYLIGYPGTNKNKV